MTAEIPTEKGTRYYYKLSAKNSNDQVALSNVEKFVPQGRPACPASSPSIGSTPMASAS